MKASYELLQNAVNRQIMLTETILKLVSKKFGMDQFEKLANSFVLNFEELHVLARQLPTLSESVNTPEELLDHIPEYKPEEEPQQNSLDDSSMVIKRIVGEYLVAYAEYMSDCGCTLALPRFSINHDPKNISDAEHAEKISEQNCKELERFFIKKDNTVQFKHTYGLHKTLSNLQIFLGNLKFKKDNTISSCSIEVLIAAIKTKDLIAMKTVTAADPNIIGKPCPIVLTEDEVGFTPLMVAAKYCKSASIIEEGLLARVGNMKVKKQHIRSKADCDEHDINALYVAARHGSPEVFNYFLTIVRNDLKTLHIIALLENICAVYLPYQRLEMKDLEYSDPETQAQTLNKIKAQHRKDLMTKLHVALMCGSPDYDGIFNEKSLTEDTKTKLAMLFKRCDEKAELNPGKRKRQTDNRAEEVAQPEKENESNHIEDECQNNSPSAQSADEPVSRASYVLSFFGCKRRTTPNQLKITIEDHAKITTATIGSI